MATKLDPRRYYTTAEIKILKQHYPLKGSKGVQAMLPHRSLTSIQVSARRYGIKATTRKSERIGYQVPTAKLPKEIIAALRSDVDRARTWPGMSKSDIARAIGVAVNTVSYHIKKGHEWADEPRQDPASGRQEDHQY
jgi:hypothetical protein